MTALTVFQTSETSRGIGILTNLSKVKRGRKRELSRTSEGLESIHLEEEESEPCPALLDTLTKWCADRMCTILSMYLIIL